MRFFSLVLFFCVFFVSQSKAQILDQGDSDELQDFSNSIDPSCLSYKGGRSAPGPQELEQFKVPALNMVKRASKWSKNSKYEQIYYAIQNAQFAHGEYSNCNRQFHSSQKPSAYILPGQCKIFFCYSSITQFVNIRDYENFVIHIVLHEANHLTGDYGNINAECSSDRIARQILQNAGSRIFPSGYDPACGMNVSW